MAKLIFQIINIIFIILYVYPGSILGFIINKDFSKQPQITSDFMLISSNHVYAFLVLSLTGILSYFNVQKVIIFYLFFISIILEILHIVIPNRSFQYSDLFGNIVGVLLSFLLFNIYYFWRKK